ncbi:hypothetical protein [Streptomyces sp. NPDC101234]|uniref:hypothetical protein n=1 Tax=Streptomyces sp. NPDC101234 TaxID=3366138 RepID=UPI00381B3C54
MKAPADLARPTRTGLLVVDRALRTAPVGLLDTLLLTNEELQDIAYRTQLASAEFLAHRPINDNVFGPE